MPDAVQDVARQHRLMLMGRLHDAEDEHDAAIRFLRAGVDPAAVENDASRWRGLGLAIVELARAILRDCAASAYGEARPGLERLAMRLVEAVDDQIDAPAWAIVNAQVRLEAARSA